MARRADHTREELIDLAVKAGLELIKKEGFSNFSARKVATKIGYTIGTLYNIFGSHDDLIMHINARTLDDWFAAMQSTLQKNQRKNPLHVLAQAYIDYSRDHYHQWVALFEHHAKETHKIPDWYMVKMIRFFNLVEDSLRPFLKHNRSHARRASRVLWAGIHGICILSSSGKLDLVRADSAEKLTLSFIDNYISGLTR